MALLSIIFERKLYRMHLKINGEHIRGRIMTVCIGSAWGYGQAPSAVPYNGWLDVSVIYRPELLQLWSGLWMLIQGRILNHKVVMPYRTQKVKVLRAQNASVDLDGRILDRHFPLDISGRFGSAFAAAIIVRTNACCISRCSSTFAHAGRFPAMSIISSSCERYG